MDPKEKEHCGKFFDAYDETFVDQKGMSPADKAKVRKAVNDTVDLLKKRAKARADGKPVPKSDAGEKAAAQLLAKMQLDLVNKFFGPKVDWDRVQACFVAFANGELRTGKSPSGRGPEREPNGSYFFLFAEFALLAIECGFNVKEWTELARIMVKAQEVFLDAYPPVKGSGATGLFRPRKFVPKGKSDEKRKKKLHDKYKKKTLKEIIDCHNKILKKAAGQKTVAYIPPTKGDAFASAVQDRVHGLLDKVALASQTSREPAALLQLLIADLRTLLGSEFGQYGFLGTREGEDLVSEASPINVAIEELSQLAAVNISLSSIQVEHKGIGREFILGFRIADSETELRKDMRSRENAYEIGASVFSQVIQINGKEPINLPLVIDIVEDDPANDDTGSVSANLLIDPGQGSGTAVIQGGIESGNREKGFGNFHFTFDWTLS